MSSMSRCDETKNRKRKELIMRKTISRNNRVLVINGVNLKTIKLLRIRKSCSLQRKLGLRTCVFFVSNDKKVTIGVNGWKINLLKVNDIIICNKWTWRKIDLFRGKGFPLSVESVMSKSTQNMKTLRVIFSYSFYRNQSYIIRWTYFMWPYFRR